MHELSVMSQIVGSTLKEAEKSKLKRIASIYLEIGELTFLGEEQMRFAFEVLTKDTVLKNSKLYISKVKPMVLCLSCNYKGPIAYANEPSYHLTFPKLACPKCNSQIQILKGKECIIKKIVGEK